MAADYDRIRRGLALFIQRVTSRIDYLAHYPCAVQGQNADGTLELKPDDSRFGPGLSKIAIRHGIPGITVIVKQPSRVMLYFENGDPTKPAAALWDVSTLDTIVLTAKTKVTINCPNVNLGDENGLPVARQGDIVDMVFPPAVPVVGTLAGQTFVGTMTLATQLFGVIDSPGTKTKAS